MNLLAIVISPNMNPELDKMVR